MYSVVIVDEAKCIGCKTCMQTCPEPNAIAYIASRKKAFVISEKCKGCGVCEVKCPKAAITLQQIVVDVADEEECPVIMSCPI
ncbi:MAG: Electron transport complex subunit RsxB [candidate division WS2 bacterium]|nr:Electron transport complex subunit RsxB [Candidatus Psychracetigena formicireducens]